MSYFVLSDDERTHAIAQVGGRLLALGVFQRERGGDIHFSSRTPVLIGARDTTGPVRAERGYLRDGEVVVPDEDEREEPMR